MATSSMVPYSNPAGNNQTSPLAGMPKPMGAAPGATTTLPTAIPTNPLAVVQQNPMIPATAAAAPAAPGVPATPGAPGDPGAGVTSAVATPELYQQLQDIYGPTGVSMYNFLNQIGGVNAQTLQDYIKSLQPQFAKSGANLRASLGAGGVSANSSVAALGEANLGAQEDALIAGESGSLLQNQLTMEQQMLQGIAPTAQQQVSDSSPWAIFGDVLNAAGGLAGSVMGLGDLGGLFGKAAGGKGFSVPSNPTWGAGDYERFNANMGTQWPTF